MVEIFKKEKIIMTEQEKQLLVKALCGYLPHGVMCSVVHKKDGRLVEEDMKLSGMFKDGNFYFTDEMGSTYSDKYIPYLRPMTSMTEEELNECVCQSGIKDIECPNWQDIPKEKQFETRLNHSIDVFLTDSNNVDWLNANHFDYRGLIDIGLALEAPEDMYKHG